MKERLNNSYLKDDLSSINMERLDYFVSKIEKLDDKKFINMFKPIFYKIYDDTAYSPEFLAEKFLQKKENLGSQVKELSDILVSSNGNGVKAR